MSTQLSEKSGQTGGDRRGAGEAGGHDVSKVRPALLLECEGTPAADEQSGEGQYLVVSDGPDENARLGLPIDRVIGLVDGHASRLQGPNVVAERKPVDGRVVSVINPRRLVERAVEVIESAVA